MGTKETEATRTRLTRVDDVGGADPGVRAAVSRSTEDAETASSALRAAIRELHQADDEAWQHYATAVEAATLRFDAMLGMAAAKLRAERATSQHALEDVLEDVATSWRARADEIRVQTHLGEMDARDAGLHTLDDLERAEHGLRRALVLLRTGVGSSLASMRTEVRRALDEANVTVQELRRATSGHA